jgi:hypothetical protein
MFTAPIGAVSKLGGRVQKCHIGVRIERAYKPVTQCTRGFSRRERSVYRTWFKSMNLTGKAPSSGAGVRRGRGLLVATT